MARALARGGTQSLGLAISGLSNPYFMDVVAAIEQAAGRAGHTLLLGDTREDPEHELRIVRTLAERQVDGLLLAPSVGALEHTLPYLESTGIPVVLLDRFLPVELDQVGCDNEQPTARLVEHLIDLGHTRIAMAIGIRGLSTTEERVRGYRSRSSGRTSRSTSRCSPRPARSATRRARRCTRCSTCPSRRPRSSAATTS